MRYSKRLLLIALCVLGAGIIFAQETPPAQPIPEPPSEPAPQQFDLPITESVGYVVQPRDTLDEIGALFDVDVDCIRAENGLTPIDILQPEVTLTINIECPPYDGLAFVEFPREAARGVSEEGTYFIKPADTLDTIGQELNISVQALIDANGITDPTALLPGDVLVIPADAPPYGQFPARRVLYDQSASGTEEGTSEPAIPALRGFSAQNAVPGGQEYVVQLNDTLDTIAQEFNVSVVSLQVVNNLETGDILLPGDVLLIPDDAPAYGQYPALEYAGEFSAQGVPAGGMGGEIYVVQPGDTLDTIGRAMNVSADAIAFANDIDSPASITPGLALVIPADAPAYGVAPDYGEPAGAVLADGEVYIIQRGDTLDRIGARFNKDTRCIIEANQITNVRAIRPGQSVGIPADCPAYTGADVVPAAPPATTPDTETSDTGNSEDTQDTENAEG